MRKWPYFGLAGAVAGLVAVVGLGIGFRQQWSWMLIPTWITAGSGLGLFAGAVVTAFYAQKTFTSQSEELRDQREFNERQVKFNERQLEIAQAQQLLAREAERRQRTPRFRADVLTRNDGSVSMYLHLRLLSEDPLDRIDVKLLDRIDGFPVDCPIGFTPGQWGFPGGPTTAPLPGTGPGDTRTPGCVTGLGGQRIPWSTRMSRLIHARVSMSAEPCLAIQTLRWRALATVRASTHPMHLRWREMDGNDRRRPSSAS